MAMLYSETAPTASEYRDRRFRGNREDQERKLSISTTVYVGNLSFFTTEEQIFELFSKVGEVKRIIMGLDRQQKTPCGFCFVEYYARRDAEDCVKYISGSRLDDRVIRVDLDAGFEDGRQWGRGKSGGQVRDEYRVDYDAGRGGYGKVRQFEMAVGGPAGMTAPPMPYMPGPEMGGPPPPGQWYPQEMPQGGEHPYPHQPQHGQRGHGGGGYGGGGGGGRKRYERDDDRRDPKRQRDAQDSGSTSVQLEAESDAAAPTSESHGATAEEKEGEPSESAHESQDQHPSSD